MKNYVAVDLKVIEVKAPNISKGSGTDPDRILASLVRLWHRCWSLKSDTITSIELAGVFGGERIDQITASCVANGVLEVSETEGFRIKGADQYLRIKASITAGHRKGGLASKGNLKRGKSPGSFPGLSPAPPRLDSGSPPASPPNTEHRTPRIETLSPMKPATSLRLKPLTELLVADFEEIRGEKYKHGGAKDTVALKGLLPVAVDGEVRDRWRKGLRLGSAWPGCSTFAQLAAKWNDLGAPVGDRQRVNPNEGVLGAGQHQCSDPLCPECGPVLAAAVGAG